MHRLPEEDHELQRDGEHPDRDPRLLGLEDRGRQAAGGGLPQQDRGRGGQQEEEGAGAEDAHQREEDDARAPHLLVRVAAEGRERAEAHD